MCASTYIYICLPISVQTLLHNTGALDGYIILVLMLKKMLLFLDVFTCLNVKSFLDMKPSILVEMCGSFSSRNN